MVKSSKRKRILIFGAGVIGSTYGGLIARAGHDVTLLARGKRLEDIKNNGLLLQQDNQADYEAIPVNVIDMLDPGDRYDYVFVTLRKDQVSSALPVLKQNCSQNFVFMVNNPSGYDEWTDALGAARVLPAFPGSGGKIENGIVRYQVLSGMIQPTTIGEINGRKSGRLIELRDILKRSGFRTTISKRMDSWQKTHVALVGPLGDVIYLDGGNNYTVSDNIYAIRQMNRALRENFRFLRQSGIGIEPTRLNIIRFIPFGILNFVMKKAFNTRWAETVISNHALNGRDEMRVITREFLDMAGERGFRLNEFEKMYNDI